MSSPYRNQPRSSPSSGHHWRRDRCHSRLRRCVRYPRPVIGSPTATAPGGWRTSATFRGGGMPTSGGGMPGPSASPQGHVAYVESVNANGSFVVSEMNWWGVPGGGWNRVDYRTVTSMRGVLGFIY